MAGIIALAALLGSSGDAPTQSAPPAGSLVAADPEPNALLVRAPDRISLTFGEPVDLESATVSVLRLDGGEVALGQIEGDDASPTRISARPLSALGAGDYTVLWSGSVSAIMPFPFPVPLALPWS